MFFPSPRRLPCSIAALLLQTLIAWLESRTNCDTLIFFHFVVDAYVQLKLCRLIRSQIEHFNYKVITGGYALINIPVCYSSEFHWFDSNHEKIDSDCQIIRWLPTQSRKRFSRPYWSSIVKTSRQTGLWGLNAQALSFCANTFGGTVSMGIGANIHLFSLENLGHVSDQRSHFSRSICGARSFPCLCIIKLILTPRLNWNNWVLADACALSYSYSGPIFRKFRIPLDPLPFPGPSFSSPSSVPSSLVFLQHREPIQSPSGDGVARSRFRENAHGPNMKYAHQKATETEDVT